MTDNIAVSAGHKIVYRAIEKAIRKERDDVVDGPNGKIDLYRLYMEKIMSKT